ncbi:MAG: prepilin-type N-terminal cleavage/methylation domain-containing protein [bacterium]|nr:prepilin-type N-terminal cleavage/methylation domain-containing protein [bacterium]
MSKKNYGFTLIELLIVVAIIAILAAIAIPNFLAAQTRAKVTRSKGEMKSLATALEAYYVDNTTYPDDLIMHSGGWPWYVPDCISTPIGYISSGKLRDLMRPIGIYGGAYPGDRYRYLNYDVEVACQLANSSEYHWSKRGMYPGWPGVMTYAREARGNYGKWRLSSCGPDGTAGPLPPHIKG